MNVHKVIKPVNLTSNRKHTSTSFNFRACLQPGLLEQFQNNNSLLDQVQTCLEAYLESKRVIFPRFYFLSNDELLEILAQTRNPKVRLELYYHLNAIPR